LGIGVKLSGIPKALKVRRSKARVKEHVVRTPVPWVESEKGIISERARQKTCSALSWLISILV